MVGSDFRRNHVTKWRLVWSRAWRSLEFAGLVTGLAIGSVGVLAWTVAHGHPGVFGHRDGQVVRAASAGREAGKESGGEPDPAALDAEWAAYSARSTCAGWAGGDGVRAVRLNSSQIAWFFSDTYLGPAGPAGFSRSAGLVNNSVVLQTVAGQRSRFVTLTGGGTCDSLSHPARRPSAAVGPPQAPGGRNGRYWAEDGIMIGDTVIQFYNRYLLGNVPYVPTGTVIAAFPAGQLGAAASGPAGGGVARPRIFPLPSYTPPDDRWPIVWGAALLRAGNTVYVYGTQTPDTANPDRSLYLAQVPASRLTQFTAWRFYAGGGKWTAAQQRARPLQPATSGLSVSSGFSVIQAGQRYWLIQANPLAGTQDIDAYPASAPWGPFDRAAGIVLYRDPGIGLDTAHDYRIMYEARAEPALSTGRTLVISYNVNSLGVTAGCVPMSSFTNTVTLPRFITVPTAVLGAANGGVRDKTVTAAAPDYPHVAAEDPSQWFDEWNYRDGCPPVPAVASVRTRPQADTVRLSWPDAGLGVGYLVYVLSPGAGSYQLRVTTGSDAVTLSGLRAGSYVARVVPVNLRHSTGPASQVAFTIPGRSPGFPNSSSPSTLVGNAQARSGQTDCRPGGA